MGKLGKEGGSFYHFEQQTCIGKETLGFMRPSILKKGKSFVGDLIEEQSEGKLLGKDSRRYMGGGGIQLL